MMELDMEVHHHEATVPISALNTVADALPGLGIVAAVLGVVITMGALGGPPEEIGHKVAADLQAAGFKGVLTNALYDTCTDEGFVDACEALLRESSPHLGTCTLPE